MEEDVPSLHAPFHSSFPGVGKADQEGAKEKTIMRFMGLAI